MSPQTAPLTFLPSHSKSMFAVPEPLATCTGSASETVFPPNATSGLPVFRRPVTSLIMTARSYSPMVTTFLILPPLFTPMFESRSVTESTKPATTRWISVRASAVGTPTRTPSWGIPCRRRSFATASPSFARSAGIS